MRYDVYGMSCAACSTRVENAVSAVDGVTRCEVNLLTNSMNVEGDASPERILAAVEKAGYRAALQGEAGKQSASAADPLKDTATSRLMARLISSLVFLVALMYVSMGHSMWGWPLPPFFEGNVVAVGLLQLLLSAIIMIINQRFFISGFQSLLRLAPNMDTLVAMGSSAAFVYSTCLLFMHTGGHAQDLSHHFYFESAAMIVTLITVGKMLESRAKGKTTNAIKSLMALRPSTATVIKKGVQSIVPIEQVKVGDLVIVRAGENIPVDGIVREGGGAVNEAALTGESIPVDKAVGDTVSAATILQAGYAVCEATRVGEDTTLSQIIRMVSDAAATKAPIAKIADKVSGVFVPMVIALALIATVVWLIAGETIGFALARGISVLVISCPCALGLATPVAIMVGSGVGAKHGILFKTAVSLEQAGKVDTVVLDKTGTITKGEPAVTALIPIESVSERELLQIAVSLEIQSEHPLAKAVLAKADAENIAPVSVTDFVTLPGNGLKAKMGNDTLYGGNAVYMASVASIPETLSIAADSLAEEGNTPLYFAKNKTVLGVIAVADVLRKDSPTAIAQLQGMGLRVVMLTGDNHRTAAAIGTAAGVDEVIADVMPSQKEAAVRRLQQDGRVMMVGDGINDAPALTRADIGVAIGAGADVAIDAADIVLVNSRLSDVPAAVRLSRAVLKNIRENLFWAFIYNIIGIPLAAGVFIPLFGWEMDPMFGAAAMSLSSFCVVTNALRLNFKNIHCAKHDHIRRKTVKKERKPMTKTMKIEGMMCGHCSGRVKSVLEALPEVDEAVVSHESGTATLTLNTAVADDVLKKTVEDQGYKVIG